MLKTVMLSSKWLTLLTRRLLQSRPWPLSRAVALALSSAHSIEEERVPRYDSRHYYPMRQGETLHGRYQVAAKLGWGTSATVWLARDLHQWRWLRDRYVAIKVKTNNYADRESAETELKINEHVSRANVRRIGHRYVRTVLDSFDLPGPDGTHICMVFKPLREPLWLFKRRFVGGVLPWNIVRLIVAILLQGWIIYIRNAKLSTRVRNPDLGRRMSQTPTTDRLPTTTDLKPDNILVKLENASMLEKHARDEFEHPMPRKELGDRTIYLSRNDFGPLSKGTGVPTITDFGLAVRGDSPRPHRHPIQADIYRSPEVILGANWSYSADIWNLGVMIWDLLEVDGLFEELHPQKGTYTSEDHLAHMIALMGPPPQELLDRGRITSKYFEVDGKFKYPDRIPAHRSLKSSVTQIEGEEKTMFLGFVSRMLRWLPEDRSTAQGLLKDPWIAALG